MPRALGYATVAVLRAVLDGVGYGLDVMERTGLPSGTVYPTLRRLERRGFVQARWEPDSMARTEGRPRRRYYRLTGAGEAALRQTVREYGHLLGGLPPGSDPEEAT